jgi:hypothetical protein
MSSFSTAAAINSDNTRYACRTRDALNGLPVRADFRRLSLATHSERRALTTEHPGRGPRRGYQEQRHSTR